MNKTFPTVWLKSANLCCEHLRISRGKHGLDYWCCLCHAKVGCNDVDFSASDWDLVN